MTDSKKQDEWETIGILYRDLVKRYFPKNLDIKSLKSALVKSGEYGMEIVRGDKKSGYAIIGELQVNRDVEARLNKVRANYESQGRIIEQLFFDLREDGRIGGLAWRI